MSAARRHRSPPKDVKAKAQRHLAAILESRDADWCERSGKRAFESAAKARRSIREHHPSGLKLYVYLCPYCNHFHKTRKPS